jgi:hypothetical protein
MNFSDYITIVKDFTPLAIGLIFIGLMLAGIIASRPVLTKVIGGLAERAGVNALGFGLAMGYGLSASLSSLAEQATVLNWLVLAALAKVVNPFIIGVLAYTARSTSTPPTDPK